LQRQVQQARNPQQKSELKNKLNDIHHEISNRTQKQLQAFAEQNPKIKKPEVTNNLQIRR
jgi:ribosomal protein S20